MIIQEVLDADCNVDRIEVTVRNSESTAYIMRYCIGRDVKPGLSECFAYEAECGDIYESSGLRTLFIKRIIQFRQMNNKPQGKEMCFGVLTKEIPKEILELTIGLMSPYNCGSSDNMHGYRFDCYTNVWNGIPGEKCKLKL